MSQWFCNDVIGALEKVMMGNTINYREDFELDKAMLIRSAKFEPRAFVWMSRTNGTYCFPEREVFMKGTTAHDIWKYYYETSYDVSGIITYIVDVTGFEDGRVLGKLYKVNYPLHCKSVIHESVPAGKRKVCYERGDVYIPVNYPVTDLPDEKLGGYLYNEVVPDDPDALKRVLHEQLYMRDNNVML